MNQEQVNATMSTDSLPMTSIETNEACPVRISKQQTHQPTLTSTSAAPLPSIHEIFPGLKPQSKSDWALLALHIRATKLADRITQLEKQLGDKQGRPDLVSKPVAEVNTKQKQKRKKEEINVIVLEPQPKHEPANPKTIELIRERIKKTRISD